MVISFPRLNEGELISVMDVIEHFVKSKQANCKLFFKCDMDMFDKNEFRKTSTQ